MTSFTGVNSLIDDAIEILKWTDNIAKTREKILHALLHNKISQNSRK